MRASSAPAGRQFKIETMGAVDGPGLRYVLFLQGCVLRCPCCHNPESWPLQGGEAITVEQVLAQYGRYRGYYRSGGLTLTGGEPLVQAEFSLALLEACAAHGIHTAVDTSGFVQTPDALLALQAADLVMLDVKYPDPAQHEAILDMPLAPVLGLLGKLSEWGKPVWIRHVVIPGQTDTIQNIRQLAAIIEGHKNTERVELLPFRKLCLDKYEQLGIPFPLADTPTPDPALMKQLGDGLRALLPGVQVVN